MIYIWQKKKSVASLILVFVLAIQAYLLLPRCAYCFFAISNSQLRPQARRQLRSFFDFMSLSDKCLSIILLGVISLSCPHKVHHLTKIYGSVRNKPKGEKKAGVQKY